jgi:hypothetical protein
LEGGGFLGYNLIALLAMLCYALVWFGLVCFGLPWFASAFALI